MKNKSFKWLLLSIVLLIQIPGVFYVVYELNSVSDSEALLNEVYENQLNTTVFAVNQFAWDVTGNWFRKSEDILRQNTGNEVTIKELQDFVMTTTGITSVMLLDSILDVKYFINQSNTNNSYSTDNFSELLKTQRGLIKRLFRYQTLNYNKIETIDLTIQEKSVPVFISIISDKNREAHICLIIPDRNEFVRNIISQRLAGSAGAQFDFAIEDTINHELIYSTDRSENPEFTVLKPFWIFPEYKIAIKQKGPSIADSAKIRLYRNLSLLLGMNVLLLAASVMIYKTIKKETELAELRTDFVSNVSHELRTPLSLIRMFAETLEMNRIKDESKKTEYYRTIISESERLTRLINNILSFSKMEKGKHETSHERVDLNSIIKKIISIYQPQFDNLKFVIDLKLSEAELVVNGDRELLTEAFQNLIDNAVKYSPEEKYLKIESFLSGKECVVRFSDHGIGIAPEHHKKIFEKFYRVSSGLVHTAKGSGVGLALVKYIIHEHQGRIELASEIGKGSEFTIYIPSLTRDGNSNE